ncbi:MAG TPA: hypothetical protein VKQ36_11845 [Ktedonobacterales bacterium]|nr:hypothetical protein [Ktedonobacterales bacterium]
MVLPAAPLGPPGTAAVQRRASALAAVAVERGSVAQEGGATAERARRWSNRSTGMQQPACPK